MPVPIAVVQLFRTVAAVIVGLITITLIVEPIEFAIVTGANGGVTADPYEYFLVRNRPWLLAAKMIYHTLAAAAAGYLPAWIAGRARLTHAAAVALLQVLAFGVAMITPELRSTGPDWMWWTLVVATPLAILGGAALRK
jgi:hypothetical protein